MTAEQFKLFLDFIEKVGLPVALLSFMLAALLAGLWFAGTKIASFSAGRIDRFVTAFEDLVKSIVKIQTENEKFDQRMIAHETESRQRHEVVTDLLNNVVNELENISRKAAS